MLLHISICIQSELTIRRSYNLKEIHLVMLHLGWAFKSINSSIYTIYSPLKQVKHAVNKYAMLDLNISHMRFITILFYLSSYKRIKHSNCYTHTSTHTNGSYTRFASVRMRLFKLYAMSLWVGIFQMIFLENALRIILHNWRPVSMPSYISEEFIWAQPARTQFTVCPQTANYAISQS